MHPNAELVTSFYSAWRAGDHETMARCYADSARFSDPVFPDLDADRVRAMWRMFCVSNNEIAVSFSDVKADDERGSANWEASYSFPKTGRQVHNKISASFEFENGLIVRHVDSFDFYRWSRMALGLPGFLLGWTSTIQGRVRAQADAQLTRFQSEETRSGG